MFLVGFYEQGVYRERVYQYIGIWMGIILGTTSGITRFYFVLFFFLAFYFVGLSPVFLSHYLSVTENTRIYTHNSFVSIMISTCNYLPGHARERPESAI